MRRLPMANSDDSRPNVVFVYTDQQSADMMSCAGNAHLETPAMDELAETGVRFDRAYCTNPVCSPSRTSLMTGRFPSAVDVRSNEDARAATVQDSIASTGLGHALRDAGYDTAYTGKQHLPGDATPETFGFDTLTTDARNECSEACADFVTADRDDPFFLVASFINPHDICYMAIRDCRRAISGYEGPQNATAEAALDTALEQPDGIDREEFFKEYAPPLPPNHEPQADEPGAVRELVEQRRFKQYIREEWSDERWREHRWAYCRLTEMVDAQIRRLLAALEESGKREDTVVVFTSDHGDMDAAHRLEHKTVFYEEAVRVPFIVSRLGTSAAGTIDGSLVCNGLDVLPTMCDYAGIDPPAHCDGRSVRPLVEGRDDDWRSHVRIESEIGEAIVTDRYKYALYDRGENKEQLYDLRVDPGETKNAADDPYDADHVADLRSRLIDDSNLR